VFSSPASGAANQQKRWYVARSSVGCLSPLTSAMADACKVTLVQRFCRANECGALFFVCCHCDRGHAYCSERCRQKARRRQHREANRRHQQSVEGRLDHRDRQRLYRQRRKQLTQPSANTFVTDHGSKEPVEYASIGGPFEARLAAALLPVSRFPAGLVYCRVCGRTGLLVNPFEPE
jgi:hypothetical protein